jgi:glutathione S-transferase
VLASHLEARPWLLGERFSVADSNFGCTLLLVQNIGIDFASLPALQRYGLALMAPPAFAATVDEELAQYRQRPGS